MQTLPTITSVRNKASVVLVGTALFQVSCAAGRVDRKEDRIDRTEDRVDRRHYTGAGDVAEDRLDRRENVNDKLRGHRAPAW